MAEFIGGNEKDISVGEPIVFENKTESKFEVCAGIVFHKSGVYEVSVTGNKIIVSEVPRRKKGRWLDGYQYGYKCSECGAYLEIDCGDAEMKFCPNCGAEMDWRE